MTEHHATRAARPDEQGELTRLAVRATLHAGYDAAFIDRAMPSLTVTLPLITAGNVHVLEQEPGVVLGVVTTLPTALRGIALLNGIFVEPSSWRQGIGRALFAEAAAHAGTLKAGALLIYAAPSAAGFYARMGAVRIGECPFYFSPEIVLPTFLYVMPEADPTTATGDEFGGVRADPAR